MDYRVFPSSSAQRKLQIQKFKTVKLEWTKTQFLVALTLTYRLIYIFSENLKSLPSLHVTHD